MEGTESSIHLNAAAFQRDIEAFGQSLKPKRWYRGPIRIHSNALAALKAIGLEVAEEIMNAGCITGDRINGLCVLGLW